MSSAYESALFALLSRLLFWALDLAWKRYGGDIPECMICGDDYVVTVDSSDDKPKVVRLTLSDHHLCNCCQGGVDNLLQRKS